MDRRRRRKKSEFVDGQHVNRIGSPQADDDEKEKLSLLYVLAA